MLLKSCKCCFTNKILATVDKSVTGVSVCGLWSWLLGFEVADSTFFPAWRGLSRDSLPTAQALHEDR